MFKAFSGYAFAVTVGLSLALNCASGVGQDAINDPPEPGTSSRTDDDGFDYGWLGLAGLLGLLGLLPRRAPQTGVTVRDGAGNVKQQIRT